MAYTYTERKRIRKSFGNRDSVLTVPYLLQMQKDAATKVCKRRLMRHFPSSRTMVLSR
jgi:hypothetical protein